MVSDQEKVYNLLCDIKVSLGNLDVRVESLEKQSLENNKITKFLYLAGGAILSQFMSPTALEALKSISGN